MLDPAQRSLLRRDGAVVPINAKAFDALVCVVERAGQVVPRAALAEALWPTTIVEDNNLSQTVLALRRALGDDPDAPRYRRHRAAQGLSVRRRGARRANTGPAPPASPSAVVGSSPPARRIPGVAGCSPASRLAAFAVVGQRLVAGRRSGSWTRRRRADRAAALGGRSAVSKPESARRGRVLRGGHARGSARSPRADPRRQCHREHVRASAATREAARRFPRSPQISTLEPSSKCSVRYAADRVRVSVRLIDGADGRRSLKPLSTGTRRSAMCSRCRTRSQRRSRLRSSRLFAAPAGARCAVHSVHAGLRRVFEGDLAVPHQRRHRPTRQTGFRASDDHLALERGTRSRS